MNVTAITAIVYARCLMMALTAMDASMEDRGIALKQIREILEKLDCTLTEQEELEHVH